MGRRNPQREWSDIAPQIESHLPLVRKLAAGMTSHFDGAVEFDDLVQDGTFGLARAIRSFDPTRGASFTTYATIRIRGAMLDGARDRAIGGRKGDPPPHVSINNLIAGDTDYAESIAAQERTTDLDAHELLERHLSREQALAMRMYVLDRFSMTEIGNTVGVSESSISLMLTASRRKLYERVRREELQ